MSTKRKHSDTLDEINSLGTIFVSNEVSDRQSRFIGYYSPTLPPKELQALSDFEKADHKVLAWRRESNQQSLTATKKYVAGHDDDGEKFAGKKVEQCLINANVTGACVVARYWGGIMLGPARFSHIETCAQEAIQKWRDAVGEAASKKLKLQEDAHDKERLVKTLAARDQSIVVLRALASEKEAKLKSAQASNVGKEANEPVDAASSQAATTTTISTSSTPAYDTMTVDRLRALDKARDATLSFLLKRIDKAELELSKLAVTNPT